MRLIKSDDMAAAEAKARMLFGLDKNLVSALLLAYVQFMAGRYDESIQSGFKAMSLARNDDDRDLVMFLITAAYTGKGNRKDAGDVVKSFAKPASFWSTYLDLITLLGQGRGKEAAGQIDKLIGKDKALALKLLEGLVTKTGSDKD